MLGNDLATFPDFPAEIRAPAGSLPGVSGLPGALRRPRHPHRRRPAGRARRDEPGRAQGEPRATCRRAATIIVNTDAFNDRTLQKAGLRGEPARGRLARRLPPPRGRAHVDDRRRAQGDRGGHAARGGALEELLRARADVVALPPSDRRDDRLHLDEVREAARRSSRRTPARSGQAGTTARRRRTSRSPTRSPRRRSRPGRTARSRATPRSPTG